MRHHLVLSAASSIVHSWIFAPCAWVSVVLGFDTFVELAILETDEIVSPKKLHASAWTWLASAFAVAWRLPEHKKNVRRVAHTAAELERHWGNADGACVAAWLSTLMLDFWSVASFGVSAGSCLAYLAHRVSPFPQKVGNNLLATTVFSLLTTRVLDRFARMMIVPLGAYMGMMFGPFVSLAQVRPLPDAQPPEDSAIALTGEQTHARGECVICMDARATHVLVSCGHRCLCALCADGLLHGDRQCPICRQDVEQAIRIFE
eukprot:CAMPEP_0204140174 /NCGR_PEP_ID=MMETSP0361-20130328/18843_1 /ASSEMBLY_ACC=CAM_ASM_000343 /TAXON_ID=268821 /ORGANISM="Scrippsiella Hangoei, Strain SHTV-5" /LENGTH=260 /DNA_ID=CAMNT_0051093981 /DNA_START=65 /DNA_END=847 /DNA_ORIENTATION=+